MDRIVSVGSTVTKSFEADELSVEVTISGERGTRAECTTSYNELLHQVRDAIVSAGIPEGLIRNSDFSVSPHVEKLYEKSKEGNYYETSRAIRGYEFEATVSTKVKAAFDLGSSIWIALCSCGKEVTFDFEYGLSDLDAARKRLLAEAVESAHAKAQVLADASNNALGPAVAISYDYDREATRCKTWYCAAEIDGLAEAAPDFIPTPIEVECEVKTKWELIV